MDGMDGRITFGFRPSIRPSIRPFRPSHSGKDGRKTSVFCRRMDGREYQKFLIFPSIHFSIRKWNFPSICDGLNGRIDGRMDGRILVEVGFVRPSIKIVHKLDGLMDGMDGRILVEVGFVRPSIKTVHIPAFLDGFYGRTDGRTLVESPL